MLRSVQLFKALAEETRLRILNLLAHGELCVCEIEQSLVIGQSKASRHLAYLRNAGLVTDRREGPWMYYAFADPEGLAHRFVLKWLAQVDGEIPQAAADLKALDELRTAGGVCGKCAVDDREPTLDNHRNEASGMSECEPACPRRCVARAKIPG